MDRLHSTRLRVGVPLAAALGALSLHRPAFAQEATPVAGSAGVLDGLLSLIPINVVPLQDERLLATFADVAGQLAAVGVERPESVDDESRIDPWNDAIFLLATAQPFLNDWRELRRDLIGFDLTDVDATIECGTPPETVVVLRGRFDEAALSSAWTAVGYTQVDVDGIAVMSLAAEPEIDLSTELGQIAFAKLNNACLLPDGTLVYTASLAMMRRVLATAAGDAPSLAERPDVRALLDAQVDTLVTGVLFSGLVLVGSVAPLLLPSSDELSEVEDAMATQIAEFSTMPPIWLGLHGMTAGGPLPLPLLGDATPDPSDPTAHIIYSLLMAQPGTADEAAEVVDRRLETMTSYTLRKPFREVFASWDATPMADDNVLRLEVVYPPGTQAGVWSRFFFGVDLPFLAW